MAGRGGADGYYSRMGGQGPPRICRYFQQGGTCPDGNACRFLHELHGPDAPQIFFASHEDRVWSHPEGGTGRRGFRMMAYNCLADELALGHAKELYPAVPRFCLSWGFRLDLLQKEIAYWDPDVLCLQEIDHVLDFETFLRPLGYEGDFAPRTGGRQDGCLTVWKTSKFALVQAQTIQMRPLGLNDNVALLVVLRSTEEPSVHRGTRGLAANPASGEGGRTRPPPTLVVGNTHLLFNPKRGDIKVAQARHILNAMRVLADTHDGVCILTGDFNSTPGSGVYHFIREGHLDCAAQDRRRMSGQLCQMEEGWPPSWLRKSFIPQPHFGGALMRTLTGAVGALGMAMPGGHWRTPSGGPAGPGGRPPAGPPSWPPATPGQGGGAYVDGYSPSPYNASATPGSYGGMHGGPPSASAPIPQGNPAFGGVSPVPYGSAPPQVGYAAGIPPGPPTTPFCGAQPFGTSLSPASDDGLLNAALGAGPSSLEEVVGSPPSPLASPQEVRSYMLRHSASFCGTQALYTYRDVYGQQFVSPVPPGPPTTKMPFYYDPMVVEEPAGEAEPARHGLPRTQSQLDRQANFSTWTVEQLMIAAGHDGRQPSGQRALKREKGGPASHSLVGDYMRRDWVARHPLPVRSAYADILGQEPQFTSCHSKFIGTVDYLWYTPEGRNYGLKPRRVLLPPPLECLHCGLPSPQWPSDHVSIIGEFSFVEPGAIGTPDTSAHGGMQSHAAHNPAIHRSQSHDSVPQHTRFTY